MARRLKDSMARDVAPGKKAWRAWGYVAGSLLCLALFAATSVGCTSSVVAQGAALRSNAAEDMKCSHEDLTVDPIDFNTAGVEGCGYRATYAWNDAYQSWVRKDLSKVEPRSASLPR